MFITVVIIHNVFAFNSIFNYPKLHPTYFPDWIFSFSKVICLLKPQPPFNCCRNSPCWVMCTQVKIHIERVNAPPDLGTTTSQHKHSAVWQDQNAQRPDKPPCYFFQLKPKCIFKFRSAVHKGRQMKFKSPTGAQGLESIKVVSGIYEKLCSHAWQFAVCYKDKLISD